MQVQVGDGVDWLQVGFFYIFNKSINDITIKCVFRIKKVQAWIMVSKKQTKLTLFSLMKLIFLFAFCGSVW